jgi:hypothetical protein
MDAEGSVLIAQDSPAVVSDSTVAEVGLLDPAGVASLLEADSEGDSPAADAVLSAAALDEDPAEVVSEAVPCTEGSTAEAATGNCLTLIRAENKTAGGGCCQPFFFARAPRSKRLSQPVHKGQVNSPAGRIPLHMVVRDDLCTAAGRPYSG